MMLIAFAIKILILWHLILHHFSLFLPVLPLFVVAFCFAPNYKHYIHDAL